MPNAISAAALVPGWLGARVPVGERLMPRVAVVCLIERPDMGGSEEKFPPAPYARRTR